MDMLIGIISYKNTIRTKISDAFFLWGTINDKKLTLCSKRQIVARHNYKALCH